MVIAAVWIIAIRIATGPIIVTWLALWIVVTRLALRIVVAISTALRVVLARLALRIVIAISIAQLIIVARLALPVIVTIRIAREIYVAPIWTGILPVISITVWIAFLGIIAVKVCSVRVSAIRAGIPGIFIVIVVIIRHNVSFRFFKYTFKFII